MLFPFLVVLGIGSTVLSQNINFKQNDDFIKVTRGSIVEIKTDTAYVISTSRAVYINEKLDKLDEIQGLYNNLVTNRNELLDELKNTRGVLTKLVAHVQRDSTLLSDNITELISELDSSLTDLKNNNDELKQNNNQLRTKINQLERLVGDLKKETKHIWWTALGDKFITFIGGVGVGILIAAI